MVTRVGVLLCAHNRREQTLACLRALAANRGSDDLLIRAVLVDDGSRDGTAAAVRAEFGSWVQVLRDDGTSYWCRAMHRAFAQALRDGHDAYLWLNDDTLIAPDAVARLVACAGERRANFEQPVIVVGTVGHGDDEGALVPSYGGRIAASRWRRTAWRLVTPKDRPLALHTMDGNLVLVTADAARRTGNLDPAFEHAMGDHDYGLRARAAGVGLWLAPGLFGRCTPNPRAGGFDDPTLPRHERWRRMLAHKGLPWRSWLRFTRRHAGWAWPLYFLWPYLRVLLGGSARREG